MKRKLVIWKYVVAEKTLRIEATEDCQILDADFQGNQLCVWVLHNWSYPTKRTKKVEILMTGEERELSLVDGLRHIATRQRNGIVIHVFEHECKL